MSDINTRSHDLPLDWGDGWWSCPQCGASVAHGTEHECALTARLASGTTIREANPDQLTLQRIANALDRIAAALEAPSEHPETGV